MKFQYRLPDLGEGITESEIVSGVLKMAIQLSKTIYCLKLRMIKRR
ncbi:hypothetical protein MGH68_06710 [Erysipelothrix sp. D19-032]